MEFQGCEQQPVVQQFLGDVTVARTAGQPIVGHPCSGRRGGHTRRWRRSARQPRRLKRPTSTAAGVENRRRKPASTGPFQSSGIARAPGDTEVWTRRVTFENILRPDVETTTFQYIVSYLQLRGVFLITSVINKIRDTVRAAD